MTGACGEGEMVACFLRGEWSSERFGADLRRALKRLGEPATLVTEPDVECRADNVRRREVLRATRGYGDNRELFIDFPSDVQWCRAVLSGEELACVRYVDYSYWIELSGGSRLARDAAVRIESGVTAFGVPNDRFVAAAHALRQGATFPPLILVGVRRDELVCLEGNLRLTAHALAGIADEVECLVGTSPSMAAWAQ